MVRATVDSDVLDEGKERLRHLQQRAASIPVLYIDGARLDKQCPGICIDQVTALAAFVLFPDIMAPWRRHFQ